MGSIVIKEIKSYFKSLFGWIFLAVFTLFTGLYFDAYNIYYGSPLISETITSVITILIFILPLLTMKIISEEKRQKTDQFLITAPISLWKVILGKFLAIVTIMLAASMLFVIGTLILTLYGKVPVPETIISIVAFLLLSCALASIGMFMSSITEHQFLAAIFTYFAYIFSMLAPSFVAYIFGSDKLITKIMSVFDIYGRFGGLISGVIAIGDVLYLLSVIFIFLILSYVVFAKDSVQILAVGKTRFFVSKLSVWLVIAVIVGLNFVCGQIDKSFPEYTSFDVSSKRLFSLTAESKKMLSKLDKDVTVYVLAKEEETGDDVKKYLKEYRKATGHFNIEYKSMQEFPGFYMDYCDVQPSPNSLIVVMGEESRVIDYYDLYELQLNSQSYSYEVTGIDVEGQLTAAISSLANGENLKKIYCLTGHNEMPINSFLTNTMKKGGYVFEDLSLISSDSIPEDCDILLVNGPNLDISESEAQIIKDYLDNAGYAILIASPQAATDFSFDNYDSVIEYTGVEITKDTVLESNLNYMFRQDPGCIIANTDMDSPVSISDKKNMLFLLSRGFKYDSEALPDKTSINPIVTSSNGSYTADIMSQNGFAEISDSDNGPFNLALNVRKYCEGAGDYSNVILIGSYAFLYSEIDTEVAHGNTELVINSIKYLLPNNISTTIPAKNSTFEYITVAQSMVYLYMLLFVIVLPASMLIAGISIVIARRRK